jgi:hypothetical protein
MGCFRRLAKTMGTERHRVPLSVVAILGLLCASACGGSSGSSSGSSPSPRILPPTISKSFGAAQVVLSGATTLTFNLSNHNTGTSLSGIGFTDALPGGLVVATPNGLTGSCGGGTITATAGSNSVSLSARTLASAATCNFTLNVLATATGSQNNTTSAVISIQGGSGWTASPRITVTAPNYSALLPGIDAWGGRLDPTLSYMFVNRGSGQILPAFQAATATGAMLDTEGDNGTPTLSQQWRITSNNDGYFQIASLNPERPAQRMCQMIPEDPP